MQAVRHYFPGGNTPEGFFSYYDEILKGPSKGKLAVIKGGPGCGKSTFMKKLGKKIEELGKSVSYLHCSSDPDSLDGVYLPEYHTAVIDATAPHIVDARYPGVCDKVLNFCDMIDDSGIRPYKDSVISLNESIGNAFSEGYHYLRSAREILYLMEKRSRSSYAKEEGSRFCLDTLKRLPVSTGEGSVQKMFLSAITPGGFKNYLSETLKDRFVVMLRAESGDVASDILKQLSQMCQIRQIDMQQFFCPMNPGCMEHLVLPSANFAITVSNPYHTYENPDEVIYFSDFCKNDYDNTKDALLYEQLMKEAVSEFSRAKALHDQLEQYYIPHVDFQKADALIAQTLSFLMETS